jgi:hypothetical protein
MLSAEVLHRPTSQKFERPPFWNGWSYGIEIYDVEVTLNGMMSLLNLMKMYQMVQKLLVGYAQTSRQTAR